MEALQYIYTSWKNGSSAEKGYMIYSRSEGITEKECQAIKDAMQYLAPKQLNPAPTPREIADVFPYSFSYFILPTGRGCVAESTYLGKDYSGRFGNYIIHALIFDIKELPCRPAEFFGEPYIKTAMTQEELDAPSPVPPLPVLHISDYASVINDDQLNEFLFDKEDELAQLISMILAAKDAGVPFYLNDSRENLVLWSAAVSRILPFRMAVKFTFNTYIGDHESMKSQRAREEGLSFHLIGVRPDANYFDYAAESKSNRQIVMDLIGHHMTPGIAVTSYAQAMAASSAFDYEEVDSFGEFIEGTTFNEINGHLQDAYLYYRLLKDDELNITEDDIRAVLSFGTRYCSEADNSDVGSKLLIKCQESGWLPGPKTFASLWKFVCGYSGFMIFTLYELFTETVYQYASEASEPCETLKTLICDIKDDTPRQYSEYLDYLNSADCVERLIMYLSGHGNPFTNDFYIRWLLRAYTFPRGISDGQPVSRLLRELLKNLTHIQCGETQMMEILVLASDNQELFADVTGIFGEVLKEPKRLDLICDQYAKVSETLTQGQLNQFERLLSETPRAAPIAIGLCARKIALSKNPNEEFWRFYNNQKAQIAANPDFAVDPVIRTCLDNVDEKERDDVAVQILREMDVSLIRDGETLRILTDAVDDCSVDALSKMDGDFLQRVCQIRAGVDKTGLNKVKAVFVGKMLESGNAEGRPTVSLLDLSAQTDISLRSFDKSDYEEYVRNYLSEYLASVRSDEDISALIRIFGHRDCFRFFADDYILALKKMRKNESDRWKEILGLTCVYLVSDDGDDRSFEELYKVVVRYLRTLDSEKQTDLREALARKVPTALCESLFDDVRRKEPVTEKLGGFFRRK